MVKYKMAARAITKPRGRKKRKRRLNLKRTRQGQISQQNDGGRKLTYKEEAGCCGCELTGMTGIDSGFERVAGGRRD
jgi:hypothetical protein